MRQRYDEMLHKCAIPHLYGLSLMGTSLRIYCGNKATRRISPTFIRRPDPNQVLRADFLEGQWNLDILSPDGFAKMQEIVAYINAEVGSNIVGQ
jgi:hypothetical protein